MPLLARLLPRRPRLPEAVRGVALLPGERRLAYGLTPAGEAVVATDLALHLPRSGRVEWADIEKATWRRPQLTVVRVARVEGTGPREALELVEDDRLADVVRSQVTASIGWSDHVRLAPAGGVRVVGRRRPGRELLDWQLVFDEGTDPDDAALHAQAAAVVDRARRTIG